MACRLATLAQYRGTRRLAAGPARRRRRRAGGAGRTLDGLADRPRVRRAPSATRRPAGAARLVGTDAGRRGPARPRRDASRQRRSTDDRVLAQPAVPAHRRRRTRHLGTRRDPGHHAPQPSGRPGHRSRQLQQLSAWPGSRGAGRLPDPAAGRPPRPHDAAPQSAAAAIGAAPGGSRRNRELWTRDDERAAAGGRRRAVEVGRQRSDEGDGDGYSQDSRPTGSDSRASPLAVARTRQQDHRAEDDRPADDLPLDPAPRRETSPPGQCSPPVRASTGSPRRRHRGAPCRQRK
jgi:hypothetical protein